MFLGIKFGGFRHHWVVVRFGKSYADVAQLVARNLAKVQVAGSNPVVRSDIRPPAFHRGPYFHGGMAERRGKGLQIPLHGFKSRSDLQVRNDQSRSGDADVKR